MPVDDPQRFRRRLERQRELLDQADDLDDRDREAIHRYARRKSGQVAVGTLATYLRRLRRAAEYSDVALVDLDEDAYRDFVFELRHDESLGRGAGGLSDATMKSYEDCVCQFLEVEVGRGWAGDVERTTVDRDPVDPESMLKPDDIEALVSAARYQRDVALIEFLADTAARVTLVASLRVRDVALDGEKATYTPNGDAIGLKGAPITQYPVIDAAAPLRQYVTTTHPRPDDLGAPLFHKLPRYRSDGDDPSLAPSALTKHLNRIGRRAGVDKPVNAHQFRHSAITRMYREGFTKGQIQHRVHWELDTDMWDRYVHLEAAEVNDDIFAAAGVVDDVEAASPERAVCGNCGARLAEHHRHCPRCGMAASQPRRELLSAVDDAFVEAIAGADDASLREQLLDARSAVREDPSRIPDVLADDAVVAESLTLHR